MPLKTENNKDQERDVQKKKRWLQFVEDLKRFYEGFVKVAFELEAMSFMV